MPLLFIESMPMVIRMGLAGAERKALNINRPLYGSVIRNKGFTGSWRTDFHAVDNNIPVF